VREGIEDKEGLLHIALSLLPFKLEVALTLTTTQIQYSSCHILMTDLIKTSMTLADDINSKIKTMHVCS